MNWYELTTDVMVRGNPRSAGEILDLSEAEGQLLVGLGRAKPAQAPQASAPSPAAPAVADSTDAQAIAPSPKPATRRRSPAPTAPD